MRLPAPAALLEPDYVAFVERCAASDALLDAEERRRGFTAKRGSEVELDELPDAPEGVVAFARSDDLRRACLRVLCQLPVAIEELVDGLGKLSACWTAEQIRQEAVTILATHNYVRLFDFLGPEPDRYFLSPEVLRQELARTIPRGMRGRLSPLAAGGQVRFRPESG